MMRGKKESLAAWNRRLAKRSAAMRRAPGKSWRILAHGGGRDVQIGTFAGATDKARAKGTVFDEVVIDDWLHLEQMDRRLWWLHIGDRDLIVWIRVPRKGPIALEVSHSSRLGAALGDAIALGQVALKPPSVGPTARTIRPARARRRL